MVVLFNFLEDCLHFTAFTFTSSNLCLELVVFCNIMNLCNFSSFVVGRLRVFARSVSVLIVGCLQQGIGVGHRYGW